MTTIYSKVTPIGNKNVRPTTGTAFTTRIPILHEAVQV